MLFVTYFAVLILMMVISILLQGYDSAKGNYHRGAEDMIIISIFWPFFVFIFIPLYILYEAIFAVGAYFGSRNKK